MVKCFPNDFKYIYRGKTGQSIFFKKLRHKSRVLGLRTNVKMKIKKIIYMVIITILFKEIELFTLYPNDDFNDQTRGFHRERIYRTKGNADNRSKAGFPKNFS